MKFQDLIFLLVFAALLYKHNPKHYAVVGLLCLILSIPLFAFWVFFTAEHLVWYAGGFFLASVILLFINELTTKSHSGAKR